MLALNLIFGDLLMPDILGMVAGHLYYFLTVLHPLAGGKFNLKTPFLMYPTYINMYIHMHAYTHTHIYIVTAQPHR